MYFLVQLIKAYIFYRLQTLLVDFLAFNLEYSEKCEWDYFNITLGNTVLETICGHAIPQRYSISEEGRVHFYFITDALYHFKGFSLTYEVQSSAPQSGKGYKPSGEKI